MDKNIVVALVVLGGMFLFFLIGRELVCWYWKINRQTELLEKILVELRNKNGKTDKY